MNALFLLIFSSLWLFGAALETTQGVVVDKPIANLPHAITSWGDKHLFATSNYPKNLKRHYENDTFGMLASLQQNDAPHLTLTLVDNATQMTRTLTSPITQAKTIKAAFLPSGALVVAALDYQGVVSIARWESTLERVITTKLSTPNTIDIVNIHPHYDTFALVTLHDHVLEKGEYFGRGNARVGFELSLFDPSLAQTAQHFIGIAQHNGFVDSCFERTSDHYYFATSDNNLSIFGYDKRVKILTPSTHTIDTNTSLLGLTCDSKSYVATSHGLLRIDGEILTRHQLPIEAPIEQAYNLPDNGWLLVWHTPSTQGDIDAHIMRTNAAFEPLWHHWLSTPFNDTLESLHLDANGAITLHGQTYNGHKVQLFALRLDAQGKIEKKVPNIDKKEQFFRILMHIITQENLPIERINETTLRINLPYAQGAQILLPADEERLKKFWKHFIDTIQAQELTHAIQNIRLVGATSSEWNDHPHQTRHLNNSTLSLGRGQNMLTLLYQTAITPAMQTWIRKHTSVEGIAMTRPVVNQEALENFTASRRNELIIEWKP